MATETLTGSKDIFELRQSYAGSNISVTAVNGDSYVVEQLAEDLTEAQSWAIRIAEDDLSVTATGTGTYTVSTTDAAKLRKGEIVKVFDASDNLIGSVRIFDIDTGTGVVTFVKALNEFTYADASYLRIKEDHVLAEGQAVDIATKEGAYLVAQGSGKLTMLAKTNEFLGKY